MRTILTTTDTSSEIHHTVQIWRPALGWNDRSTQRLLLFFFFHVVCFIFHPNSLSERSVIILFSAPLMDYRDLVRDWKECAQRNQIELQGGCTNLILHGDDISREPLLSTVPISSSSASSALSQPPPSSSSSGGGNATTWKVDASTAKLADQLRVLAQRMLSRDDGYNAS